MLRVEEVASPISGGYGCELVNNPNNEKITLKVISWVPSLATNIWLYLECSSVNVRIAWLGKKLTNICDIEISYSSFRMEWPSSSFYCWCKT